MKRPRRPPGWSAASASRRPTRKQEVTALARRVSVALCFFASAQLRKGPCVRGFGYKFFNHLGNKINIPVCWFVGWIREKKPPSGRRIFDAANTHFVFMNFMVKRGNWKNSIPETTHHKILECRKAVCFHLGGKFQAHPTCEVIQDTAQTVLSAGKQSDERKCLMKWNCISALYLWVIRADEK